MSKDKHSMFNRKEETTMVPEAPQDNWRAVIELLREILDDVDAVTAMANSVADGMIQFRAKLRMAEDLVTDEKRGEPIFVYRYKGKDGVVGYVPDDEDGAKLKAYRLAADGIADFGYAFRQEGDKYTGFELV